MRKKHKTRKAKGVMKRRQIRNKIKSISRILTDKIKRKKFLVTFEKKARMNERFLEPVIRAQITLNSAYVNILEKQIEALANIQLSRNDEKQKFQSEYNTIHKLAQQKNQELKKYEKGISNLCYYDNEYNTHQLRLCILCNHKNNGSNISD